MEWNIDDLFKKEPPMLHYAGIRPSSRRTSTPRRQKKKSPRPDDPKSSNALPPPPPLITRVVRGVVDLVSSAEDTATQDEDGDETDLEDDLLPKTVEFDHGGHHYESDDNKSDDDESEIDNKSDDDESENLLED